MQAVLDTYNHIDWFILEWILTKILHDEFLLLCDLIILSADDNVDIVSDADHDAIVSLKLFFAFVKCKLKLCIVCE
jgi:hypothetical protein